jgi:hypothetical protein
LCRHTAIELQVCQRWSVEYGHCWGAPCSSGQGHRAKLAQQHVHATASRDTCSMHPLLPEVQFVQWLQIMAGLVTRCDESVVTLHMDCTCVTSIAENTHKEHYSGWRHLFMHVQPCMQGSGDVACLLCMLGAVNFINQEPRASQAQGTAPSTWITLRSASSLLHSDCATLGEHGNVCGCRNASLTRWRL